jgi:imidazolonepropionase
MIAAGLPAIATDYNRFHPIWKHEFCCGNSIKMKMTPEEAINAATINGAYAMEFQTLMEV